jgi:integrase
VIQHVSNWLLRWILFRCPNFGRILSIGQNDLLDRSVDQGIVSLKGVRQSGDRAGNWLTWEQARDLLAQPEIETMEGKQDRAILAVLLGCALRRSELASLECGHIQQRDGRWVFVDLVGKGKRVRTVPIPPFVKVRTPARSWLMRSSRSAPWW